MQKELFLKRILLTIGVAFLPFWIFAQCNQIVDLRSWAPQANTSAGNWVVNSTGTQVHQTINGNPAFFISSQSFINVRMTGQFYTTNADDDAMGFVFGWQDATPAGGTNYDFDGYLFDWSQYQPGNPATGMSLSQFDGVMSYAATAQWWQKQNTSVFQLLNSYNGATFNWNRNQVYNFELIYQTDRVQISIDGTKYFDITGCFKPGKFGFYNFSQADVFYQNFQYEILPDFTIADTTVCVSDSAQFYYIQNSCAGGSTFSSVINSFNWNFGDGNSSNQMNPAHLYTSPGNYNVQLTIIDNFGCLRTVNRTITILPEPITPNPTSNGPICSGNTLGLTANGGSGVTYAWSGPGTFSSTAANPTINNAGTNASGTYTLVTSIGQCSSPPTTTTVTVNPTPATPTATSNGPICSGNPLNFTGTAGTGVTYNWDGPNSFFSTQANPSIAVADTSDSGTYILTVANANCQSAPSPINVVVNETPPDPVPTSNGPVCEGSTLTISSGGSNAYGYSWTGPGGYSSAQQNLSFPNASDTLTGTYTVTATTPNCSSNSVNVSATVYDTPALPISSNNGPICAGTDLNLNTNAQPGATFTWSGPNGFSSSQQNPVITGATTAASGTYSVFATINGCPGPVDSNSVVVNPSPTVTVSGNTNLCSGETTTLTATGANNFNWNTGANNASITVTPTTTTTFTVNGNNSTGCPAPPVSVTVTVNALPAVSLGPDLTVCDSFTLDAGPNVNNYAWSTGASSQTISVLSSGTYSVTVSNSASCVNADTIAVTVNATNPVDLGADQSICSGASATLAPTAAGYSAFNWSTGAASPSISTGSAGTYFLSANDANGCPSSDSVTVSVFAVLSGDIGNDTLICDGSSVTLDASSWNGATYVWSPGAQNGASITATTAGTYSVLIDDGNGCTYGDTLTLAVDTPPTISVAASDSVECAGDPITLTVIPSGLAAYDFLNGGVVVQNGSSNTFSTNGLSAGNSLSVQAVTANGCPTNSTAALSINILPRPSGTTMADTVCLGFPTTLSLNANSAVTATWSGGAGFSGNGNLVSYVYPSAGTFNYTVNLDNGSCDTTLSGTVLVLGAPSALTTENGLACNGEDAVLRINGGPGTYEWYNDAAGTDFLQNGDSLMLAGITSNDSFYVREVLTGCNGPLTLITAEVVDNPVASFLTNPDTSVRLNIPQSDVQFVNLSSGATNYLWDFGDGNTSSDISPIHNYSEPGLYTVLLIARTGQSCLDSITYGPFEVLDFEGFTAPSGFSPNGDADNETWVIDDIYYYPNHSITVFNRWGDLVLEARDYQNDWDGSYNGKPLPEGTYYWVIDLGDGSEPQKGFVVIFR